MTRRSIGIRILSFALACALPSLAPAKNTGAIDRWFGVDRPSGPVEKSTARDVPLKLDGATEAQSTWLKEFALPVESFETTTQLLTKEDDFTAYRLTFPSPAKTPWPENNVVPAELYVPKTSAQPGEASKKMPAVVVLDILDGGAIIPRILARAAAQRGLVAIYVPMPCYNARRPKDDAHLAYLKEDPHRVVNGIRQTVLDVRRAKAVLAARGDVDPQRIGITGVSLGGIMTALCAGVDGEFWKAVPILAGGDIAAITFHAHETRQIRDLLVNAGLDQQATADAIAPVEPLNFASRIKADRCLMINAKADEVIPASTTESLRKAIGDPKMVWVQSGHYTALGFLPTIQQEAITFLGGDPPKTDEPSH